MANAAQIKHVGRQLSRLIDVWWSHHQLDRDTYYTLKRVFRRPTVRRAIADGLYGQMRKASVPDMPSMSLYRLEMKETTGKRFGLVVFKNETRKPKQPKIKCLIGHRFTGRVEQTLRWNLRQLFDIFGVEEVYSGFDGAAAQILDDLREKIHSCHFSLFDNRDTTTPSKPNVYIEAGMAYAMRRPFVFCHYKREVWPADFSNVVYLRYSSYEQLFRDLYSRLPIFLREHVSRR